MSDVVLDLDEVVDDILNDLKPRLVADIRDKYIGSDRRGRVCQNKEVRFGGLKKPDGTPVAEPIIIAGDTFHKRIRINEFVEVLRSQGLEVIMQRELADDSGVEHVSFESIAEHVDTIKRLATEGRGTLLVVDWDHSTDNCEIMIDTAKRYNMPIIEDLTDLFEQYQEIQTVCICGSYKFIDEMKSTARYFIDNGLVVHVPRRLDVPEGDTISDDHARAIHLRKIEDSDLVVVVDPQGYIGENTLHEIEFALMNGKSVFYTEQPEWYDVDPKYIGLENAMDWVIDQCAFLYHEDEEEE